MKKKYNLIFLLLFTITLHAQIVNIPDTNFKEALLNQSPNIDSNNDNEIQLSEALGYTGTIDVSLLDSTDFESMISDFAGIEAFANITGFFASGHNYSGTLDLSSNTELEYLDIGYNYIDNLNILNCYNLIELNVSGNLLNSLDVSSFLDLEVLIIRHTNYSTIDLSQNLNLRELSFFASEINTIDLSNNLALESLHSGGAPLSVLDITNNINLTYLEMQSSSYQAIDLSQNINLETIACYGSNVLNFDFSNNINLKRFGCGNNEFTSLDFSQNILFERFVSQGNDNLEFLNLKNGNNINFTYFEALGHPNLTTVCVDDVNYAMTNFIYIDDSSVFSTCDDLSVADEQLKDFIHVYPNPINYNIINIHINPSIEIFEISLITVSGKKIILDQFNRIDNRIIVDSELFPTGVFFLNLVTSKGDIIKTLIKSN